LSAGNCGTLVATPGVSSARPSASSVPPPTSTCAPCPCASAIASACVRKAPGNGAQVLVGGGTDDSEGFFVEPTVIETSDPNFRLLRDELFGPVVTAYVYPEREYSETLELVDRGAPYGLTGAVFAQARAAIDEAGGRPP